ncbi:hypothetical protein [Aliikangiella maris]|uniref:HTH CENPB-type domain-containing protein n=2 Tax=Aliikangiella maris TaxID=3162458 RepID=A0ABV3MU44_9GAMM
MDYKFEKLNYYWCFQYETGGVLRPSIYVKKTELCYSKAILVSDYVMNWLDEQDALGAEVTGEMLQEQADIFIEKYKERHPFYVD